MYFGNLITGVSLRKCFYLSAIVLVLSTLMAALIIVKLSQALEAVKCQPQSATAAAVEWSTSVVNFNNQPDKYQQQPQQQDTVDSAIVTIAVQEKQQLAGNFTDDNIISSRRDNDRRYRELREKMMQNKIARMSRKMRNKVGF